MDEIEELVVLLGASNLKTEIFEITEDSNGLTVGAHVNLVEQVGIEVENQNKNTCSVARIKKQEYPDNKIIPNQQKILENKNMQYIFIDNDLKKILIRRIVSKISSDNYTYVYSKSSEFKNILDLDLGKFGIKFSNEKCTTNSFMIKCLINYHPVPAI